MDAPRVRYVKTEDGTGIGCAVVGSGPPLVAISNLGLANTTVVLAGVEGFTTGLSARRSVIHFDHAGSGLSDRAVTDLSLDAQVECVRAVVDGIAHGAADIYGWGISAATAVAFAARYPDKTRKLVLANPCVTGAQMNESSTTRTLMRMAGDDWGFVVTTLVSLLGVDAADQEELARTLKEDTTPEAVRIWVKEMEAVDASRELRNVVAPTLVLRPRSNPFVSSRHVAQLAANIEQSQLAVVESAPLGGVLRNNLDLVWQFLDDGHTVRSDEPELRIILFTDIQDHSAMIQRLGDSAGRAVLREHERMTRAALAHSGGAEVKALGDGFMAWFGSARRALECASSLQRAFGDWDGEPIVIRVGINAGEPIAEDDDLFGASVITAARVAAEAGGGEILVSNVVRELVAGKGFLFTDRGSADLKGLDEPVRLFELNWQAILS
jgi:class 3 adenylate cyclase